MDVTEAVRAARAYLEGVFADEDTSDTRLEEVEYHSQEQVWNVTFSFLRPTGTLSPTEVFMPGVYERTGTRTVRRDYKVVAVASSSGQATSIKHRSLESAE
ncbi:MAG: hypothetical protein J4F37_02440 [Acidobacteria bacterium]|nr:hypothetical protein [Acidobacteriota bacterium]